MSASKDVCKQAQGCVAEAHGEAPLLLGICTENSDRGLALNYKITFIVAAKHSAFQTPAGVVKLSAVFLVTGIVWGTSKTLQLPQPQCPSAYEKPKLPNTREEREAV